MEKENDKGIRVKDGKELSAVVTYFQGNITQRLVILKEEAKKAGFNIKLKQLDPSAAWKSYLEKKHELAFVAWARYRPSYFGQYHSSFANEPQSNNFANIADPGLDKLIEQYRASTKESERVELAHKIQQSVHDKAIQVPLFEVPFFRLAYWSWIKFPENTGTRYTRDMGYFGMKTGGLIWIDKAAKKSIKAAKKSGKKLELKPGLTRLTK